jgi:hypothetical protein
MKIKFSVMLVLCAVFSVLLVPVVFAPPTVSQCAALTSTQLCNTCCEESATLGSLQAAQDRLGRVQARASLPAQAAIDAAINALPASVTDTQKQKMKASIQHIRTSKNARVANLQGKLGVYNACVAAAASGAACSDVKPDLEIWHVDLSRDNPIAGVSTSIKASVRLGNKGRTEFAGATTVRFTFSRPVVVGGITTTSFVQSFNMGVSGTTPLGVGGERTILSNSFTIPSTATPGPGTIRATIITAVPESSIVNNQKVQSLCLRENALPYSGCGVTVKGRVYADLNGDTQVNYKEGTERRAVTLHRFADNTLVATTCTDASGDYAFPNVADGGYYVKHSIPSGYTGAEQSVSFSVGGGANYLDIKHDFRLIRGTATTAPGPDAGCPAII